MEGRVCMGRPVRCRWMYPVERYLCTQKKYVRNKCQPEGSIAEAYIVEECLTFCLRYLDDGFETRLNRLGRNDDGVQVGQDGKFSIFAGTDRPIGKRTLKMLLYEECEHARLYVLRNCDEVAPFIEKCKEAIKRSHRNLSARDLQCTHNKEFGRWFEKYDEMRSLQTANQGGIDHSIDDATFDQVISPTRSSSVTTKTQFGSSSSRSPRVSAPSQLQVMQLQLEKQQLEIQAYRQKETERDEQYRQYEIEREEQRQRDIKREEQYQQREMERRQREIARDAELEKIQMLAQQMISAQQRT